jgi:hypothetical protein
MSIETFEKTAKDYMDKIAAAKEKLRHLEETLGKLALTKNCIYIAHSYPAGEVSHKMTKAQQKKFAYAAKHTFFKNTAWGFSWVNTTDYDVDTRSAKKAQFLNFIKIDTIYLEIKEGGQTVAHRIMESQFTYILDSLKNNIVLILADAVDGFLAHFAKELDLDLTIEEENA